MVSFAVQKLVSLIRSYLFIFVFISTALGEWPKKTLVWFMSENILPMHKGNHFYQFLVNLSRDIYITHTLYKLLYILSIALPPTFFISQCIYPLCFFFIFVNFLFFKNFYWSIVALQCCVSFYHIAKWTSHMYTYIPSFLFPSHLGHHRALSRVSCAVQ